MKKLIIYLMFVLVFASFAYAAIDDYNPTNLYTTDRYFTPINLSYSDTIQFPPFMNHTCSLYINGSFNQSLSNYTSIQYTPNATDCDDASCDGNFDTSRVFSIGDTNLYNYTKPANASAFTFIFKSSVGTNEQLYEETISSACFDQSNTIQINNTLKLAAGMYYACHDGTNWVEFKILSTGDNSIMFDSAARWSYNYSDSSQVVFFNEYNSSQVNWSIQCYNGTNNETETFNALFTDIEGPFMYTNISDEDSFNETLDIFVNFTDNINVYSYNISLDGITLNHSTYGEGTNYSQILSINLRNITYGYHNLSVTVYDGIANNTNYNQSNYTIFRYVDLLTNCSAFDDPSDPWAYSLNFSVIDEESEVPIVANSTITFNISEYNLTYEFEFYNLANYSICIFPQYGSYTADYSVEYVAPTYTQRSYDVASTVLNNQTVVRDLTLLLTNEGLYVRIRALDSISNPISGVIVTMASDGTTHEIQTTDDSGIATFFADPDTTYTFTLERSGYTTRSVSFRPTSTDIVNVIMSEAEEETRASVSAGITYSFAPTFTPININTSYNFTFTLFSNYWNISGCLYTIEDQNNTEHARSETTYNASQCNITFEINTYSNSSYFGTAIVEYNDTYNITYNKQWGIRNTTIGDFTLENFLDDIRNFTEAGFNEFTLFMIAFIIIISITAASATFLGVRDPEAITILIWAMVFFFTLVDWLRLPIDSIPTGFGDLQRGLIFYVVTLFTAGFIIIKRA